MGELPTQGLGNLSPEKSTGGPICGAGSPESRTEAGLTGHLQGQVHRSFLQGVGHVTPPGTLAVPLGFAEETLDFSNSHSESVGMLGWVTGVAYPGELAHAVPREDATLDSTT